MSDRLRTVVLTGVIVLIPGIALAQEEVDWTSTAPITGVVVDGELFLEVTKAGVYPVVIINEPEVEPPRFSIESTVRHQDVAGIAYLEMWTVLEDESRYFTRTLAETGPLGFMTGSAESRPIVLPFELGEGGPTPVRLEINLVTEGAGRFWLGALAINTSEAGAPTVTTQAPTTVAPLETTPQTSIPADSEDGDQGGASSWPWLAGGGVLAVGFGVLVWSRSQRRRRLEEQRRMDAIDSVRS